MPDLWNYRGGRLAAAGGGGRPWPRRRPPTPRAVAGGDERLSQAAAVRPTLKRDTSTVLDAAHVHRLASNLCTQVLLKRIDPAQKKGPSQRSMRPRSRFCPTRVPSLPICRIDR